MVVLKLLQIHGDNVDYKVEEYNKVVNKDTKEDITKLEDIFYENTDYKNVINEKIRESLNGNEKVDKEKIEEYVNNAEFEIQSAAIKVTIPDVEDFELLIFYSNLDENLFKFWTN